jgi:hypothetical protein
MPFAPYSLLGETSLIADIERIGLAAPQVFLLGPVGREREKLGSGHLTRAGLGYLEQRSGTDEG